MTQDAQSGAKSRENVFVRRIAGVFATRVAQFTFSVALSLTLARLLGTEGRGQYAVVVLLPVTLYALATFGVPSSATFYSGRGRSLASLVRLALVFTGAAAIWLTLLALLLLPLLERSVLQTAPDHLLRLVLIAIPFQFGASLLGAILYGRQIVRSYNILLVGQAVASLVFAILFVGVLRLGVQGAVLSFIVVEILWGLSVLLVAARALRAIKADDAASPPATTRELLGYGLKCYPAVVTSFFNLRVDIYLLSAILADAGQVGLYAIAVSFSSMLFYVPDSVSAIFYPRVAAATREEADSLAPRISRMTVLISTLLAVAMVPAAYVAIHLLLPAFKDSIPALLILLPAIVSMGVSRVLSGYMTGLGKPIAATTASVAAVILNIGANLLLIPVLGIVGAALASLISYTAHAALMIWASTRASGASPLAFILPRPSDARRLVDGARDGVRQLRKARAAGGARG
jgi:O-antigen/teichoic acid export membrane protein